MYVTRERSTEVIPGRTSHRTRAKLVLSCGQSMGTTTSSISKKTKPPKMAGVDPQTVFSWMCQATVIAVEIFSIVMSKCRQCVPLLTRLQSQLLAIREPGYFKVDGECRISPKRLDHEINQSQARSNLRQNCLPTLSSTSEVESIAQYFSSSKTRSPQSLDPTLVLLQPSHKFIH